MASTAGWRPEKFRLRNSLRSPCPGCPAHDGRDRRSAPDRSFVSAIIEQNQSEPFQNSVSSAAPPLLQRRRTAFAPAIACPSRASLAHLEFFAGFCSSQKWWCLSVKLRRPVCPSLSV